MEEYELRSLSPLDVSGAMSDLAINTDLEPSSASSDELDSLFGAGHEIVWDPREAHPPPGPARHGSAPRGSRRDDDAWCPAGGSSSVLARERTLSAAELLVFNSQSPNMIFGHMRSIDSFGSVRSLFLSHCGLSDSELLLILSNFPNLEYLDVSRNRLTGVGWIQMTTCLEHLVANSNEIADLSGMQAPQLSELYLNMNNVESLDGLFGLDTLRVIALNCNRISEIPPFVAKFNRLHKLELENNNIRFLPGIFHWRDIKTLKIGNNPLISMSDISTTSEALQDRFPVESLAEGALKAFLATGRTHQLLGETKRANGIPDSIRLHECSLCGTDTTDPVACIVFMPVFDAQWEPNGDADDASGPMTSIVINEDGHVHRFFSGRDGEPCATSRSIPIVHSACWHCMRSLLHNAPEEYDDTACQAVRHLVKLRHPLNSLISRSGAMPLVRNTMNHFVRLRLATVNRRLRFKLFEAQI